MEGSRRARDPSGFRDFPGSTQHKSGWCPSKNRAHNRDNRDRRGQTGLAQLMSAGLQTALTSSLRDASKKLDRGSPHVRESRRLLAEIKVQSNHSRSAARYVRWYGPGLWSSSIVWFRVCRVMYIHVWTHGCKYRQPKAQLGLIWTVRWRIARPQC